MNADELVTLYFRTTLRLTHASGENFEIRPLENQAASSADPKVVLAPYQHAFILTAENPESLGELSPEQNAEATAALRRILVASGHPFRDCPGYALDSDHVEPGFAILAHQNEAAEIQGFAIGLAESFRQNAIFHLDRRGLEIIGALREDLDALRPVSINPA